MDDREQMQPKKGLSEEVDKSISIASQRDRLKKKERNINYLFVHVYKELPFQDSVCI